jgi:hypothetical protein
MTPSVERQENVWQHVVRGTDHAHPKLLTFSMTVEKAMASGQGQLREIEGRLTVEWRNVERIDVSRLMRRRKAQRRASSRALLAPGRNIDLSMRNASALHMLISIVSAHCSESPPSFP